MQRELQPAEVSDFLSRNFDMQAAVLQHQRIVDSGQWDQVGMNESIYPSLPIPTKGRALKDDKFGVVVIYPDAKGRLHFLADVSPTVLGSDIAKPPYESPSGNTMTQFLEDMQKGLQTALGTIVAAALIVGLVYLGVVKS